MSKAQGSGFGSVYSTSYTRPLKDNTKYYYCLSKSCNSEKRSYANETGDYCHMERQVYGTSMESNDRKGRQVYKLEVETELGSRNSEAFTAHSAFVRLRITLNHFTSRVVLRKKIKVRDQK